MVQTGSFHLSAASLVAGLRCPCYNGLGEDPDPSECLVDIGENPISAPNERWRRVEGAVAGAARSRVVVALADAAGDSLFGRFLCASVSPCVKRECSLDPHPSGCVGTRVRWSFSLGLASASMLEVCNRVISVIWLKQGEKVSLNYTSTTSAF